MIAGILLGVFGTISFLIWRMLRSDGWDQSNITNALRLLSHVAMHPEDFVHMYYVSKSAGGSGLLVSRRAFPYLGQDELSEVVATRPTARERV